MLNNLGVSSTKQNIKVTDKKLEESEVTKEAIKEMDISQIVENMQLYEQEIIRQESSEDGKISLSAV